MSTITGAPIRLGPITVTFLVEAEASGGSVTVSRCDVEAGGGMPVAHSHDAFEETVYGLQGTVTLTVDGTDIPVGPGEAYCIARGGPCTASPLAKVQCPSSPSLLRACSGRPTSSSWPLSSRRLRAARPTPTQSWI
jgi:Cupin domain